MSTTGLAQGRRPGYRRLQFGSATMLVERRTIAVALGAVAALLALGAVGLLIGDYPLNLGQALRALFGVGGDPLAQFFVRGQRAPRVLAAMLVGAALAVSGAIFQSLSDNPLGSPDVIGFTTGSATGALIAIIVIGAGPAQTAVGALVGGAITAAVVYLLAWRRGLTGGRLILVGIGIAAVLQGVNNLLLVRASLTSAQTAGQWLAGSFNATTWPRVLLVGGALALLLPAAGLLARPLGALVLGDDLAAALGVRVEWVRALLVVVGVALVAVATAAAGPINFIALAAPQIARRLTRTSGIGLGTAALLGAMLVLASDLVAQRLFAPTQLAVGVVTGVLGGGYLIWLLGSQWRKGAR
ncbi:MAG: iron chelate uptake ABC transporter family permease subunit [Micropruina sp.]|uniref:FecCD family ABC transporter permease n=1 Tax=Micropruina sp. TaxID=2737536 RepID=UPI0039E38150